MASPAQWTWVWVSSRSWWWTGKPGVLQPMGSQESDMTEGLNWTEKHLLTVTLSLLIYNFSTTKHQIFTFAQAHFWALLCFVALFIYLHANTVLFSFMINPEEILIYSRVDFSTLFSLRIVTDNPRPLFYQTNFRIS